MSLRLPFSLIWPGLLLILIAASRVLRGGSWLDLPFLCRSAARAGLGPQWRRDFVGFRVAMTLELGRMAADR